VAKEKETSGALKVDHLSFEIGVITAFAEIVGVGVKRLALSGTMTTAEVNAVWGEATHIANENHVVLHRETDLLVSDLFPADVARGKEVLLIYQGSTLEEYAALKHQKAALLKSGTYAGKAREDIARQFGKLLSYPESGIDALLNQNTVRE
jgi:hypothetical protein